MGMNAIVNGSMSSLIYADVDDAAAVALADEALSSEQDGHGARFEPLDLIAV